jgi:hypothetical protein
MACARQRRTTAPAARDGDYLIMYGLPGLAVAAALAVAGCSSPAPEDYDAGHFDAARRVCFPSCRLGETCTAANRCVPTVSPFRDAGPAIDRGRD